MPVFWLVVEPAPLKNIRQNGNLPQGGFSDTLEFVDSNQGFFTPFLVGYMSPNINLHITSY